ADIDTRGRQCGRHFIWQPLPMRDRAVPDALDAHDAIMDDGNAAVLRRGVERQNDHAEPTSWNLGTNLVEPCRTKQNSIRSQCYTHAQTLPEMASPPVSSEPAGATPAMRQYFEAKRQFRDAIVFFRMGDFYEIFYEDALIAARALELTLTSRSKDSSGGAIPMCGVPHHAADGYIARLVKKGFRVAICEQMEDPRKVKGL